MKEYKSGFKLITDTWKYAPKKKKVELLKELNLSPSWAKTKSMSEMVKRGGGLPAKQLLNLSNKYLDKKGGSVLINRKK